MGSVYVLGGDPGASTGLRLLGPDAQAGPFWQGPGTDAGAVMLGWLRSLPGGAFVRFAFERYRVGARSPGRTQASTVENVLSIAAGLAGNFGAPFELQDPAPAKQVASNSFLHATGLWVGAADVGLPDADDVNDATRHAVLALMRHHATLYEALRKRRD